MTHTVGCGRRCSTFELADCLADGSARATEALADLGVAGEVPALPVAHRGDDRGA